jgi:hypothetical protein
MLNVDWSTTHLLELDMSSTDLSEHALLQMFSMIPKLTYLAVPYCDGFTDKVNIARILLVCIFYVIINGKQFIFHRL